jgi:hypothetical protein
MKSVKVENITLRFPDEWTASKYDEWVFYKNQFSRMWNNIKAVDVLATDPQKNAWFIEVKDYRRHQRTKSINLADEVAKKVFDTLAAMLPAKVNATNDDERAAATKVAQAKKIHVVLHLEQPQKSTRLTPIAIRPADVQQKLRSLLKPIDAHAVVVEKRNMRNLSWTTE